MADAEVTKRVGLAGETILDFKLPRGPKGEKGDQGDKGADGANVLPTDTAVANAITTNGTATKTALNAAIGEGLAGKADVIRLPSVPAWATKNHAYDATLDAYNLRPDNLPVWRRARARAAGGLGQAHVSTFLDSITHGANTATSNPKYVHSWPGRMARILKAELGDGGTGVVIPWDSHVPDGVTGIPPHDDRFKYAGSVVDMTNSYGIYKRGAKRVTGADGAANYIEFTATCDEFWVYSIITSGPNARVQIDGGAIETIGARPDVTTSTYLPQPGYWGQGTTAGQVVSRIPVTLGQHTIRLMAPASGGNLTLLGIEGRIAGKGIRVSNVAQSSRMTTEMVLDDAVSGYYGMAVSHDMVKSDLAVFMLPMNDFQAHFTPSVVKGRVATAIDRQRATGGFNAGGDVILVTCPQPDYTQIPADHVQTPPLTDYYKVLYELADEKDVPLIDIARRWKDFATAKNGVYSNGFFGDALHPNNLGSEDIARAVRNVLMAV